MESKEQTIGPVSFFKKKKFIITSLLGGTILSNLNLRFSHFKLC